MSVLTLFKHISRKYCICNFPQLRISIYFLASFIYYVFVFRTPLFIQKKCLCSNCLMEWYRSINISVTGRVVFSSRIPCTPCWGKHIFHYDHFKHNSINNRLTMMTSKKTAGSTMHQAKQVFLSQNITSPPPSPVLRLINELIISTSSASVRVFWLSR